MNKLNKFVHLAVVLTFYCQSQNTQYNSDWDVTLYHVRLNTHS